MDSHGMFMNFTSHIKAVQTTIVCLSGYAWDNPSWISQMQEVYYEKMVRSGPWEGDGRGKWGI